MTPFTKQIYSSGHFVVKYDVKSLYVAFEKAGTEKAKKCGVGTRDLRANFTNRSVYGENLATNQSRSFNRIVPKPTKGTSLRFPLSLYQISFGYDMSNMPCGCNKVADSSVNYGFSRTFEATPKTEF